MLNLLELTRGRPCLLLLLVLPLMSGFAQPFRSQIGLDKRSSPYTSINQFEHLSVKDGLSANAVYCILQDREGFLWFGTSDGLNKYDGYTFTVLQQDPGSPDSSLSSNHISVLYEDRSGKLWVTTVGGGLHWVDKQTGAVIPIRVKTPSDEWKQTLSIYEDRQGMLWVGSYGGLIQYNPRTGQYRLFPSPEGAGPAICSAEDRQNRFWVGTLNGLYQLDRSAGRFTLASSASAGRQPWVSTLYEDKRGQLWAGTNGDGLGQITPAGFVPYATRNPVNRHIFLNAIHPNGEGQLWLGTTEGLQLIDTRTREVVTYRANPALRAGLGSNRVQAVYRDRAGTLWLGTDQGIDKQVGASTLFTTLQLAPAPGPIPPVINSVSALLEDRKGVIWIGSDNKKLYRYDPQTDRATFIPLDPATPENPGKAYEMQSIYEDKTGQLWVSTVGALLRMDRLTGQYISYPTRIRRIQAMVDDGAGQLWLGGEGGVARFNPKNGQLTYYLGNPGNSAANPDLVEFLMLSRTGDIWMGINGKGISRLQPKTGRYIQYYPRLPAPAGQFNDLRVNAFYEDSAGVIWIGTDNGGLNRYEPATDRFSAFTTRQGLPANHVSAIINDRYGHLWISTSRGICRFNTRTKTFHTYTTEDGLPHNQFMSKVSYGRNGQLLFGSLNGVVIVRPDRIYNGATFPVYITRLGVLDQTRPLTAEPIELNHDENFISFDFVALTYRSPEKNQYAYQLVGADQHWVYSGTRHFANYSTLSPGQYTFRVKAANSDGIWNERGAAISLVIRPPWWATWWAYGVYALAFGGAVFGFVQFRIRRARQQQAIELKLYKAEQLRTVDELKTRFFSNITHEFRTPLSLIISPVEKLLQENRFDRSLLTLVQRNAEQLLRLINQLLDLSKLEANYMPIALRQGVVTEFVDHIVDMFRRAAEQKDVTLTYTVDRFPLREHVFDADKWEKILTNLLSNALKFTPSGGQVSLTLSPVWADDEMTGVELQVTDSGIGIAPEQLPHIFDRFYQADTSSTRAYEGTGIGLALVQELVELLGGTITVASEVGVGTRFHLTLPVQPVSTTFDVPKISQSAPKPVPTEPISEPVSRMPLADDSAPTLLVVEDNDELREFLVSELATSYHILQAADGEAGWALTQLELPDIVLTDVMMPRMDGYTLTRLIKEHPDTDHIAVVMLTAKSAQQSRIDGLQQGADEYLSKPFNIDELHLRLHNLISRQQKLGDYYRQQFALPDNRPTVELTQDLFLNRIYGLLEEHLADPSINVDWLAEQMAVTRKTLNRKVQSLIQLTPKELMRQYQLRKASDLLEAGHSVAETAELVGFKTQSHFTNVFREFYQQTPKAFVSSRVRKA